MGLVPDERAVQELAPASADPVFGDRFIRGVWTFQSTVRIPVSARTASNAAVKFEPRSRIMNLTRLCRLAEVYQQVPGLLGGPRSGGMRRDSPSRRPAVKKSHASVAPAWGGRDSDHAGPLHPRAG